MCADCHLAVSCVKGRIFFFFVLSSYFLYLIGNKEYVEIYKRKKWNGEVYQRKRGFTRSKQKDEIITVLKGRML